MGDGADAVGAAAADQYFSFFEHGLELLRASLVAVDVEEDHVGAARHRVHVDARDQCQAFGESARVEMILGQPLHHRAQRHDSRRRDYPRLGASRW